MNSCRLREARTLRRWARFNAVGALGFGVQLFAVYILIRSFQVNPLIATAVAVETAALHNFIWHHLLTWKERRCGKRSDFLVRLLAFNITNGAVSMGGSLFFAWLILERQWTSVLGANLLAVAFCSSVNFILSDKIVFRIAAARSNSVSNLALVRHS
jgi:putative flippase GtrA